MGTAGREAASSPLERQLDDRRANAAWHQGDLRARRRLAAHERQSDRPETWRDGRRCDPPDRPLAKAQLLAAGQRRAGAQPAQLSVRLAPVVKPGDRLLAYIAALGEGDGAFVEPRFLRDHRVVEVDPVAWASALDPDDLGALLADRKGSRCDQRRLQLGCARGLAQKVDSHVRADRACWDAADLKQ